LPKAGCIVQFRLLIQRKKVDLNAWKPRKLTYIAGKQVKLMTLIIAEIHEDTLLMMGDTRFSRGGKTEGPTEGGLKVNILRRDLCLAYAGVVAVAVEAVEQAIALANLGSDNEIHQLLTSVTKNGEVDFLLGCLGSGKPQLYSYRWGVRNEVTGDWLGSGDAHKEFLAILPNAFEEDPLKSEESFHFRLFDAIDNVDQDGELYRMLFAMDHAVNSGKAPDVGDFFASVVSYPDQGFQYLAYYHCSLIPTESEVANRLTIVNPERLRQEDAKASFFTIAESPEVPAFCIYQVDANDEYSVIFTSGERESHAFRTKSIQEFEENVRKVTGSNMRYPSWWNQLTEVRT
jgi:hypothetical protein